MDRREAIRAYKEAPPPAGVFQITNRVNGKRLIGCALNVRGRLNREKFTLEFGKHESTALQNDWNTLGPEAFSFEVLDELKAAEGGAAVTLEDVQALEALWLEKEQPYGERGYNLPRPPQPQAPGTP